MAKITKPRTEKKKTVRRKKIFEQVSTDPDLQNAYRYLKMITDFYYSTPSQFMEKYERADRFDVLMADGRDVIQALEKGK